MAIIFMNQFTKATQEGTRKHNQRLVFKTIYDSEEISRVDISRITGLTRTTVSDITSGLIKNGRIEESRIAKSRGGRPPILLKISENSRYLIGIDLADSEFRGAVINLRGKIIHRYNLPVFECSGDEALSLVYKLIDELIAKADRPILGIGIGTPGLMDPKQGVVYDAVNLGWHNLQLGELLREKYCLPIYLSNDCQVSALAEFTFTNKNSENNLALIKIGLGVGSGFILNRQLYYGDNYGAGEIGHVKIVEVGDRCRCGNYGCLETLVSSNVFIRNARRIMQGNRESTLNNLVEKPEDIDMDIILQAYEAGDQDILKLVNQAGKNLGVAITHVVSILNINNIVIAGDIARFGDGLTLAIEKYVNQGILSNLSKETRISISKLDKDIVILGASSMVLSHELGLV